MNHSGRSDWRLDQVRASKLQIQPIASKQLSTPKVHSVMLAIVCHSHKRFITEPNSTYQSPVPPAVLSAHRQRMSNMQ